MGVANWFSFFFFLDLGGIGGDDGFSREGLRQGRGFLGFDYVGDWGFGSRLWEMIGFG